MAATEITAEDRAFLAAYDPAAYPRPSLTVDVVLMTADRGRLRVALIERSEPPFRGAWSLPGVFVALSESLEAAARRALAKTALDPDRFSGWLEQLYTFGAVERDPRGRVVSVAYFALVPPERLAAAGEGSGAVRLAPVVDGAVEVALAFDHAAVVQVAVERLRGKLGYTDVGFALLPPAFTLRALQELHETILGRPLNKDSFRRRMLATGLLVPTGDREEPVGHRPAALYRFEPVGGRDG
ncbi:MAG: NUDIX domain-containing protein [Myxococcota bacterium]